MHKIWAVARTEFLNAIRSKAFIISIVALPIFMFGAIAMQVFLEDKVDVSDRRLAVVDGTDRLFPVIEKAATERDESTVWEYDDQGERKKMQPSFVVEEYVSDGSEDPRVVLSDRVREDELFAFLVIEADAFTAEAPMITYHSETPTYRDMRRWLRGVINDEIQQARFEEAGVDRELVQRLTRSTSVESLGLVEVDESGVVTEARKDNNLVTFGIPAICIFLMFMMIMSTAPALMNTVLEEKMQKIAEFLVSAVSPFQLMLGKLMGTVMVSLTLSVLYLGAAVFVADRYQVLELIPPSIFAWFLFFQLLALMIFGSIFSAIGAACNEIRDAQSMMFPAMMLVMIPLFCWTVVLQAPDSPFSRGISLFPPATPMLMMLRIAIPPGPPLWEVVAGAILTTLFMLMCVWASSKIFRIGILSQGQAPTFRRLFLWIFSK